MNQNGLIELLSGTAINAIIAIVGFLILLIGFVFFHTLLFTIIFSLFGIALLYLAFTKLEGAPQQAGLGLGAVFFLVGVFGGRIGLFSIAGAENCGTSGQTACNATVTGGIVLPDYAIPIVVFALLIVVLGFYIAFKKK